MKIFSIEDLKRLTEVQGELCLSIYMPTDPAAAAIDEQRIRFKNLLTQAEKAVQARAPRDKALMAGVAQGRRLLENLPFWRTQSSGLALFIAPERFWYYRLPISFEELFAAAERFVIKPLIPMLMADGRFYILALSQARVRLFWATRHQVMEIELDDPPQGKEQSLAYDSKQRQLQFHTGTAGGGKRPALFHGHSVGSDEHKDEIRRYFKEVDRSLAATLGAAGVPLVLAGVDYLLPIFRDATAWQGVVEEGVPGNPDNLTAGELHAQALPLVRSVLERDQRQALQRYHQLAGRGYTAAGVEAVVPAARYSQVDTLFVALDQHCPGRFDTRKGRVELSGPTKSKPANSKYESDSKIESGTDLKADSAAADLLDLAAVETLKNGGRVYGFPQEQMPALPLAAILRF
ncbi:MAG: hypothetical protein WBG37_22380 [Desulfobacterales bacterium]